MTSLPLHTTPRWRSVAGEQVRAVGLMTRKGGVALVALLVVLLVVVVQASLRQRNVAGMHVRSSMLEIAVAPWAAFSALIAALFAIAIWRDEDPGRRSYHLMMPMESHVNTLTKVGAGWVWLLIASVVSLASIAGIGVLSSAIAGFASPREVLGWSFWLVPLTSASIAYLLVSAAAVATRQPVLWVAGIILLYGGLLLSLDVLGYRDTHHVVRTALSGEYGLTAALAGDIERMDTAHLGMAPSLSRWLGAAALWGTIGAILLAATSYRRTEPAVVGGHGPFRRAIFGHGWLVTSVIVLSVVAGLVATRVMQPEYEAKATIWSASEAKSVVVSLAQSSAIPGSYALDRLRSRRIVDSVVQQLALYVRPDDMADSALLGNFSVASRFVPGAYTLAVSDSGTRWHLGVEMMNVSDNGVVGDSVGRPMGLQWRPDPATLSRYAGRKFRFTLGTPREASAELASRMTVVQPGSSSFVQLSMTDPDPHRAARALNAIAALYISSVRSSTGARLSLLDSAVAPALPFKNSPAQLFSVSIVIGIAAAIALAFTANALEARGRL